MTTFKMTLWADNIIDNMSIYNVIRTLAEVTSESTTIGDINKNTGIGDNSYFAWACSHKQIGEVLADLMEDQMGTSRIESLNKPPKAKQPRQGANSPAFKFGVTWATDVLQFEKVKSKTDKDQIYLISKISIEDLQARLNIINMAQ